MTTIIIKQLAKKFGKVVAVGGVDLTVPDRAFLTLLGPSGCGKTTILRVLAGLEEPTSGSVYFDQTLIADGEKGCIQPGKRKVGLVFQSYALWPHMSVYDNIAWPLKVGQWKSQEREIRVREVMDLLEIEPLANRYPHQISGGQQQRVAIARTIAPKPSVLLFDEPLSSLDARLRAEMRRELLHIHRATGATSIYVTHDQMEALAMATHIAVMRSGTIEQVGTPSDLLNRPASPFVASFVGTPPANLISGTLHEGRLVYRGIDLGTIDGSLPEPLLMYRAESLHLESASGPRGLAVEYVEAIPMAGRAVVTVWDGTQRLSVVAHSLPDCRYGDSLFVRFPTHPDAIFSGDREFAIIQQSD